MTRGRLLVFLTAAFCACRGGHAPQERPPAEPASAARERAAAPALLEAQTAERAVLSHGMPTVTPVLADPRLADVREREQARDWSAAARAMDAARAAATRDRSRECAWAYVAGRLHVAAGESSEAAAAFEASSTSEGDVAAPCPLASYAALHQAQALVRVGRYDDALARAQSVDDDIAMHDELQLVLADASVGRGNRAAAVPIWRALLAANPRGLRWADSALQLVTALVDGVDGPAERHAQEVFDLSSRILVEAPWVGEKVDVAGVRARAALHIGRGASAVLTPEERADQSQAWLDARQSKRATEAADALLKTIVRGGKEHREAACKAAVVRAQARPRGKAEDAADAWGAAIARCEGQDALATALYYGAKASGSAHRPLEARERFAKVEKLFPKHRLADDARLRAAMLAMDEGDEGRGLELLSDLADRYPEGDMGGEALFRVALFKLGKRDLAGSREALDRILDSGLEIGRPTAGRSLYFRARVAQLAGDVDDARRRYVEIVGDQPLSYYMLLAYGRLRALDEQAARSAIEAYAATDSAAPFLTHEHVELASPAFDLFVRLLEVGEIDSARRVAHAAGLVAENVDTEVLWTVAWLYDRSGAPELGSSLTRARLTDYREHWPVGRWRFAWEVAYPRVWEAAVAHESESAHIPTALTWAIMREESAFNPDARSVADAIGLMQLIAPTARLTARGSPLPWDEESLKRPEVSIALGARLLGSLRDSFASNLPLAIAAYNGGSGAVRRWLGERGADDFDVFVERIPFEETRAYLKRVLASQAAYAFLYEPKGLGEVYRLL